MTLLPRLRSLDIRATNYAGSAAYLLRDPLDLSPQQLIVPAALAQALLLLDGTLDQAEIAQQFRQRYGMTIAPAVVEDLVNTLDQALMLDNTRFAEARDEALHAYRSAPFRPLSHADAVYPADPTEAQAMIQQYLDAVPEITALSSGRGVFSPHIDYARGGHVYAAVWKRAAALIRDADLVVLLATDHYGEEGSLTLTRQHYATPFGILPTAQPVVDAAAAAIGEETAFAGELRNTVEHSIELVALWLHAMRDGKPVDLVPLLCGSFGGFVRRSGPPANAPQLTAAIAAIQQASAGRNVVYVVSGDLSHVGPAFGGAPLDSNDKHQLHTSDKALIRQLLAADAEGWFTAHQRIGDRTNVCGLPPGYLALRALAPAQGELVAYEQCPADKEQTSVVSVCGIVFT